METTRDKIYDEKPNLSVAWIKNSKT